MTRPFRPRLAAAAALALLVAAPGAFAASESGVLSMMRSPVAGDPTLNGLLGGWRGSGKVRRSATAPEEAAQCRLTNTWAASQRLARVLFTCHGTDFTFTADGYLGRDGSTYRGAWSTTTGQSATMTGKRNGAGLRMAVSPTGGGQPGTLTLRPSGRSMTARLTARDDAGRTFTAFEAALRR